MDRLSAKVHIVENGTHIVRMSDTIVVKQPSGKVSVEQVHPYNASLEAHKRLPVNGWMTSIWSNGPYDHIQAYWTVPNYPPVDNGQILFYFNSLENNPVNDILQPVLQLNNGVNGWTFAAWYGVGSDYYEASPVSVNPGDQIIGIVELISGTWYIGGYVNGNWVTELTVSNSEVGEQYYTQWANENYNVEACDYLPSSNSITASVLYLGYNGNEVYPSWYNEIYDYSCNPGASGTWDSATLTWSS